MQMRAMLRAAAGRELRVMVPMVSTVAEFIEARALFEREIAFVKQMRRVPPSSIKLGVMIEVPSLLWQLEEIARHADFLSVGSNDLMQYLYAADRDNKRVSNRFDVLSAGFLRALRAIAEVGERTGAPVALCGEIGGRPLEAMTLIALGFRHLSMSATSIGPIKAMTLSMHAGEIRKALDDLLTDGAGDFASLREPLREVAEKWGVRL
jgi:phosphotransferase system enzyme I (PtsP)